MTTVNDIVAVEDEKKTAGCVTMWRLSGATDPEQLAAAWKAAGLDPAKLPQLPNPTTALNRAVRSFHRGRTLVRPLANRGGHSIVNETAKGEKLDYTQSLIVKLNAVNRLVFSDDTHALVPAIRAAYAKALQELDSTDISSWLIGMVTQCNGLALRRDGGVYYVPPFSMDLWNSMVSALESCTANRVDKIPALSTKDTLRAVLNAVEAEAAKEAQDMADELLGYSDAGKALTERAGKTRLARCDEVETKISQYEELLGTKLESIRERLGDLRMNLNSAMLAASAAEAAAAE